MQQPPVNPNQPPQQGPSSFWGNMQPSQGQPTPWTNTGLPTQQGQPPFPMQGGYPPPQQQQYTQQNYPQQRYDGPKQQHPLQQYQQPPTVPPKKKKRIGCIPISIGVVILLALCGIVGAFASHTGATTTATTQQDSATSVATTVQTKTAQPTAKPTIKPTAIPTAKPTAKPAPTQTLAQIEAAYKAKTTDSTVSDLDKQGNADQGQDVHFTGRILNFVKDSSGTTAGANIDDSTSTSTSVVQIALPPGADLTQLNQGDAIDVWGTDNGTFSGTNGFGATIQEVQITANYMTDQTTNYLS